MSRLPPAFALLARAIRDGTIDRTRGAVLLDAFIARVSELADPSVRDELVRSLRAAVAEQLASPWPVQSQRDSPNGNDADHRRVLFDVARPPR